MWFRCFGLKCGFTVGNGSFLQRDRTYRTLNIPNNSTHGHTSAGGLNLIKTDFRRFNRYIDRKIAYAAHQATRKAFQNGNNSWHNRKSFSFASMVTLGLLCGCLGYALNSFDSPLGISEATRGYASHLLTSSALREMAVRFCHAVVEEVLNSESTTTLLMDKLENVLTNSQDALKATFVEVLNSDEALESTRNLSQQVLEDLCKDENAQEQVGQLLLAAIYTQTAVDGAARWVVDLSERTDTRNAIAQLFTQRILQDHEMQEEALDFCKNVTEAYLNDKNTVLEASHFIRTILNKPSVQAHLSQTLWDVFKQVICPKWLLYQSKPSSINWQTTSNKATFGYMNRGLKEQQI